MRKLSAIVAVWGILLFSGAVFADGIIITPPGVDLSVKYHRVTVAIKGQVAQTAIDQVFLNDTEIDSVEGIYIFPIPKNASFSGFSMFIDNEEIPAKIYDADSARAIYESIVRRKLDPALLEYMDRGLFRARVYPIRAKGEKRIKISYSELIHYDAGIYRYVYPLSTEKFSARPLEDVSVKVTLTTTNPIKTIYSPSHPIRIQKIDDFHAVITYTEENVKPNTDFILYYTVSQDDIGMHVLTHRSAGEDGFYLFLAAPKLDFQETDIVKKRLLFVLDRSGSMSGKKIAQAKEALRFSVTHLNSDDRFNIIAFSTDVRQFKGSPVAANSENIQAALDFIDRFSANGGTNINDALLSALGQMQNDNLANMIIFLTDGRPTVGIQNIEEIRQNVKKANTDKTRLFVFGVGYDVNTYLLGYLSEDNHGVSTYVRPEEDIEVAVSSFFSKISYPVLSNLTVDFGSISIYDAFPKELPDLFKGSQIAAFGRYENRGNTTVTLSGDVNGSGRSFARVADFPNENPDNEFIPRLWATRKVGYLLNQIRLNGESEELVDEIIALSKRYGIITPYTSFLILEDAPAGQNFSSLRSQTGEKAFDAASNIGHYRGAVNTRQVTSSEVKYVGNKTFFMRDSFWVDTQFTGNETMIDVVFASSDYFDLLQQNPGLGQYFSIGKNLVVSFDNVAYKVHEEGRDYQQLPQSFVLFQNAPNPFPTPRMQGTVIQYVLSGVTRVKIAVYDILGREIRILESGVKPAGQYFIVWDGRDAFGREVASGIYFYRLVSKQGVQMRKMIKLR